MKINLLTGFLALAVLTGCANLGTLMQPRDPNVVSAEASASSAEKWVSTFLSYVKANPQLGLGEKGAAENLERSFDPDLKNLHGLLALYKKNPMANAGPLSDAKQRVEAHEAVAKRFMNGGEIRGQGAPFAPGIAPPGAPPNALDTILGRLDGIRAEQATIRQEQAATRAAIGQLGKAVWELTNNTNTPPPVPGK